MPKTETTKGHLIFPISRAKLMPEGLLEGKVWDGKTQRETGTSEKERKTEKNNVKERETVRGKQCVGVY